MPQKVWVILLTLWLMGFNIPCLAKNAESDSGMIDPVILELPFYKNIHAVGLFESSRGNDFHNQTAIVLSPALAFPITQKLHGLLGYSRVNIYAGPNQHQDSVFLEISRPWEHHGFMINNSFRIEEIFFSNEAAPLTRGWHRIEFAHELGHRHLRLLVSNELRYNFTGSHLGPAAGFHEDRLFVGLGRCINLHVCGRVGYMLRTQFSENGGPTRFNHLLFVGMLINTTGPSHHRNTRGFVPGSI